MRTHLRNTPKPPHAADNGQFREDLFYRIDVLRLEIPALRERGADIVNMAEWLTDGSQQTGGDDNPLPAQPPTASEAPVAG